MARSASTTAYAATMTELAAFANTAYVPNYYTGTPTMNSVGAPGTAAFVSRGDHVHPSDTTRVALAGGTMTGLLTLSGAPTANLHAATKFYVDGSAPVGGPYLPLSGGTLTGALTPMQTGGLVGTTTNNNVTAGSVGEYISASVAVGSAVSLASSGAIVNVASISLTAGDWDVSGVICTNPAGATTTTFFGAWISTVSAVAPTSPNAGALVQVQCSGVANAGGANTMPVGHMRLSLAATTTVYLSCQMFFASGTMGAFGFIGARRRR